VGVAMILFPERARCSLPPPGTFPPEDIEVKIADESVVVLHLIEETPILFGDRPFRDVPLGHLSEALEVIEVKGRPPFRMITGAPGLDHEWPV
jgi:hypothetical protein